MITTVSNAAQLVTALKVAQDGDVIRLAAGTYTGVSISNINISGGVTITSADPAHEAQIVGMGVSNSSGLTFQGLELVSTGDTKATPFTVVGSHDIHFDQLYVHGSLDHNPANDPAGILVRGSVNVSITNSTFEQLYWGVAHVDDSHLTVSGNTFHDIRMDGVRGGGSSYVTISGNSFSDFHPNPGDHGDAIQFWTTGTTASAHDIVITNNQIHRGSGEVMQGIFMRDELKTLPYQHVTISGNLISGGMYNGIYLTHGQDVTVTNNIVQGFSDMNSWVRVDNTVGATVTGNSAHTITLSVNDTQLVQSGNTIIPLATDGGAAVTAQWQASQGVFAGGAPPPTPTPTPAPAPSPTTALDLIGTAGADTLMGGAGGDTLNGSTGADKLTGGAGDDVYVTTAKAAVVEAAGAGHDVVQTSDFYTLPANIEDLILTGQHSTTGQGNGGDNLIVGNGGNNKLIGAAGADTLSGGVGADTLVGGTGADKLVGGSGADHFLFGKGDGHDTVQDFGAGGEHDVIDVSAFYKAGLKATLVDSAAGVTISFSSGDSIFVQGVHPGSLHATAAGWVF